MLIPLFGGYVFGGLICGLCLTVLYIVSLVRHLRNLPWSIILALGWLLFVAGAVLMWSAQFTPQKNYSWQDGWGGGLMGTGLGFWWISLFIYLAVRKRQRMNVNDRAQYPDPPSEGVWPPPPTNKF